VAVERVQIEPMDIEATSDLWWKNSVIYCLDVATFLDGDGDGRGDFSGLIDRVDYLAGIGVNCIWLMPFYPSPGRDDGYDVTDFYDVDQAFGNLGDFVEFMRTARDRGVRVIVDLVVNHTSSDHPWFQASRREPHGRFGEWYVWRDKPPENWKNEIIFPGKETENWAYDDERGQYYLHVFYDHQPDLDVACDAVRKEIGKIIGFWLELGVSGFRVDAVPFLLDTTGISESIDVDMHEYLADIRRFISRRAGDAVLLGEVNLLPDEQLQYFGERGEELQMILNFNLNQALYLALARDDAQPMVDCMAATPAIPHDCQWANFVRNHDELTLDKLSDEEREEVFAAFAPDEAMRLYGRGIRRRLPTMLNGDRRRNELVYSLLFSLPGTPVLYYGEEIGMSENLDLPERLAMRTPMQWTPDDRGGFTTAPIEHLHRPIPDGKWGPKKVNVAAQRRDPKSFLNWLERVIRRRRECPEFGWGSWRVLDLDESAVLGHRCDWQGSTVFALHNFSAKPKKVKVELKDVDVDIIDDLFDGPAMNLDRGIVTIELDGYGYCWYRARAAEQRVVP
jgi:trehalose synthase